MGQILDNTITVSNLTKYYGKHRGIENLSIQIKSGIIFGFLGPNGSGKTTTIRCLLGILRPSRGNVEIFGQKIEDWSSEVALKENIGYLPGEFGLYSHFNVKESLDYFGSLREKPAVLRQELVKLFEVEESRKVDQLSGGNKQKVGLVQTLMHDPDIVILDEPSNRLDPLMQQRLYKVLRDFKDRGKTIFFSSHNLGEVQRICDEVAIIKEGFLVSHDHIDQLSQKLQRKLLISTEQPIDPNILSHLSFVSHFEKVHSNGFLHRYNLWLKSLDPNFAELFQALNKLSVKDIVVPEPSLEDYFMRYYKEDEESNVV